VNITVCPVCLGFIEPNDVGCVTKHEDGIGKLCPMTAKPMPRWTERATREAVVGRSNNICEYCASFRATDCHHRKSRGVGGKWHPANIIHLCRFCHARATANPEEARESGLIVESHQDPATVRVVRRNGSTFFLADDVAPPRVAM